MNKLFIGRVRHLSHTHIHSSMSSVQSTSHSRFITNINTEVANCSFGRLSYSTIECTKAQNCVHIEEADNDTAQECTHQQLRRQVRPQRVDDNVCQTRCQDFSVGASVREMFFGGAMCRLATCLHKSHTHRDRHWDAQQRKYKHKIPRLASYYVLMRVLENVYVLCCQTHTCRNEC